MGVPCPRCNRVGRAVRAETVAAQSIAEVPTTGAEAWRFCATGDCLVVYYRGPSTLLLDDVRALPFQKSTDPERLVCFCFGHTVADVETDRLANGESTIREEIRRRCRAGEDECGTRNPQGRCCLGDVGIVLRSAESPHEACCSARRITPESG